MPKLIKDGEAVSDYWTVLKEATGPEVLKAVPGKNFLVPLSFWKNYQEELNDYNTKPKEQPKDAVLICKRMKRDRRYFKP